MISDICRKCGKALCVCLPLVGPVIEAINSPPEECRLSAPCSFGDLWAPHDEEHDYQSSGTGEIGWDFAFRRIDESGYAGWVGCEYNPLGDTIAGLA
jgi:hypothetical protein